MHGLRRLEQSVRGSESDQCRFKEWRAREAAMYFGSHESVFKKERDPANYRYADTVQYHKERGIQDSVPEDVITILDSALPKTPKGLRRPYSHGARREFITRNMLSLVTIMRAYELSAIRDGFWRMPHVTRACIRFLDLGNPIENQLELRSIVVRHALYAALADTRTDSPESVIDALCDLRNGKGPRAIRELLRTEGLLALSADKAKEKAARTLIAKINSLSPVRESFEQAAFAIKWHSTLRALAENKWDKHDEQLFRVFPDLKPSGDRKYIFMRPAWFDPEKVQEVWYKSPVFWGCFSLFCAIVLPAVAYVLDSVTLAQVSFPIGLIAGLIACCCVFRNARPTVRKVGFLAAGLLVAGLFYL
ncbi:MAG: hypothetical protein ABSG65_25695 [Bryobacteraceae bacterium]|jgi:hypothetical protein